MLNIRPARAGDVKAIIQFQMIMARETEGIELDEGTLGLGVRAAMADPAKGTYWVAQMDGQVVACLLVTSEWSDWRNATVWWIQSLYVRPEHRREGVFRAMFQHLKSLVQENNQVAGIRLYVATENTAARRAYEALGMDGERYRMYEWMPEEESSGHPPD